MGSCSSNLPESGLISDREKIPEYPDQSQASDSLMAESTSRKTEYDHFVEVHDASFNLALEKFKRCDKLEKLCNDLAKRNEQLKADIERLRKRIGNNSEMSHRGHQSSSEDAGSRNKQSNVLLKYKAMDGSIRRKAMEAFGRQPPAASRAELWNRKDLTCRIFLNAYEMAESAKEKFIQQALPRFLQCAPSVGLHVGQTGSQAEQVSKFSEQCVSEEMKFLLSTESFRVASTSMLKELAVSCDLEDLEKQMITDLEKRREEWNKSYPSLPYLEDDILKNSKLTNYIKECVRLAWQMVNLLPPLNIVTVDQLDNRGIKLEDFFCTEVEENRESAQTLKVCVWPAVTDRENPNDVLVKGTLAIIPRPENVNNPSHVNNSQV